VSTIPGPDPRAATRGFIALALDLARVDPDRRPTSEMRQWLADLALAVSAPPPPVPQTHLQLLEAALLLERQAHSHAGGTAPPARVLARVAD